MKRFLYVVVIILLLVLNSYAQSVPQLINYQGKLSDANGNPLATAEYEMSFSIYTEKTGGTAVWGPQEFKDTNKVTVAKGFFNVILGPIDSIDRKIEEAFNSPNAYLEICVNGNVILPRQQVLSTSYAFQANKANIAERAKEGVTPVGSIITWATENIPEGYLECNGNSLLVSDYPELFAVLGYRYGGSGASFNLPDYRAQFLRGWSHDNNIDPDPDKDTRNNRGDGIIGNNVGTKQFSQNKLHGHPYRLSPPAQSGTGSYGGFTVSPVANINKKPYTGPTSPTNGQQIGGAGGGEARPNNIYVIYCIKYKKYNQ